MHAARVLASLTPMLLAVATPPESELTTCTGRPQREYKSADERLILRIERGRPGRSAARSCRATLTHRADAEGGDARGPLWERPLVNEGSPVAAAIRNDGRFVVTLGEAPRGGLQNALVIYGQRGQLLRHFLLTDLLGRDDWRHIDLNARSRGAEWLRDARLEFRADPDEFVATLAWGREIRVDLRTLKMARAAGDATDDETPPDVLASLTGASGSDDGDAGADDFDHDAVAAGELLDTLLTGDADAQLSVQAVIEADDAHDGSPLIFHFENGRITIRNQDGEIIRDITPDPALRADGEGQTESGELDGEGMIDAPVPDAESQHDLPEVSPDVIPDAPRSIDTLAAVEPVSDSRDPYLNMPAPEPGSPTNYVAWLNQLSHVDGPSAAPLYDSAAAKVVRYEGDAAVLDAAMRGDPDALRSPEVSGWIEANRAAIDDIRAATRLEYRGYEYQSENGDLIGVLLPNLSPVREVTRALIADGRRAQSEGRLADALTNYLDAARAGAQTGQGHTLIENLVGVAVQSAANGALLDLVGSAPPGQIDFDTVADQLEAAGAPLPADHAMQAERAMFLDATQRMFERDPDTGEVRPSPQGIGQFISQGGASITDDPNALSLAWNLAGTNFDQTIAEGNRYYDQVAAAARMPYQEGRAVMRDLESALTETTNPLLRTLTPAFSRSQFVRTRGEAERRGTITVARIRAFEQRNGRLPESLDELGAGTAFVDPFSNQPLRYQRTADGFRLYSVGDNGQDDGGTHDPKAENNDFVIWPRPPAPK